ncbi:hypothetical protein ACWIGX_19400 [Streptomyces nigrescens]
MEQKAALAGILINPSLRLLLEQIFAAKVDKWREVWDQKGGNRNVLWGYIEQGLGRRVRYREYQGWRMRGEEIKDLISPYVALDSYSPAQNPLIALPFMEETGALDKLQSEYGTDFTGALDQLIAALAAARFNGFVEPLNGLARTMLTAYADYGRFWMAFTECRVPLDEPFSISVSEKRMVDVKKSSDKGLGLAKMKMKGQVVGPISYSDAKSSQVGLRIADSNVELGKQWSLKKDDARGGPPDLPDSVAKNSELLSFYSSDEHRPPRLTLTCTLRPSGPIRWIYRLVLCTAVATLFAITLGGSLILHRFTTGHLALLLTPATFATSLLLVRESSPLSTTLTRGLRLVLVWLLAIVWLVTALLYVNKKLFITEAPVKPPKPSPTIEQVGLVKESK